MNKIIWRNAMIVSTVERHIINHVAGRRPLFLVMTFSSLLTDQTYGNINPIYCLSILPHLQRQIDTFDHGLLIINRCKVLLFSDNFIYKWCYLMAINIENDDLFFSACAKLCTVYTIHICQYVYPPQCEIWSDIFFTMLVLKPLVVFKGDYGILI